MRSLFRLTILCSVIMFSFSCGRCCQIKHAPNWQHTANNAMHSVVKIEIYENDILPELIGIGSGFVFHHNGYIMTNEHVIEATLFLKDPEIYVVFSDHRQFKVNKVVATAIDDLAILKINAQYLVPLKFEKHNHPKIGDPVISLGTPWPYDFSVSEGIVANISHQYPGTSFPWVQHTADINSGSSGGPLINAHGYVVGINQATGMKKGKRLAGINLAVSAKSAIKFIEDSIKKELIDLEKVPD